MNAKIKTLLTHGVLAISALSLNFCAPAVPDYGSGIQKLYGNADPDDAWRTYSAQVCIDLGGVLEADGTCSTTYTGAGFTNECLPNSQQESMECTEQRGVDKNGGQFWGALLAVIGQEVLAVVKDLKNENIHGEALKTYARKVLNVKSTNQTPLDGESSLNPGILKKHRLFLKKFPGKQGLSSLQFELEAKGESIATLKGVEYGKTLLMCLNASYGHDSDPAHDTSNSDTRIALKMKSKYNSHEEPVKISRDNFFSKCNQSTQEQSYIAFQLFNSALYHVFPYSPKDMGFARASGDDNKYDVTVDGQTKKMRYYAAENQLDLGMDSTNVANAMFTDPEYGNSAINNQILDNIAPGASAYETSYGSANNPFPNLQEFQKRYLHITNGTDQGTRTFCNASPQVGCM